MATKQFNSAPRITPPLGHEPIKLPEPLVQEEQVKGPLLVRLIPLGIGLLMIGFMVVMFTSGQRPMLTNGYFMMPMAGMMMGSLALFGVGGVGGGSMSDLDIKRKRYFLQLREQRKLAHSHGALIHDLQATCYPNPAILLSRCATETMWQVSRDTAPAGDTPADDDQPQALRPWLTARIGVGLTILHPKIKTAPQPIPEDLEPVTAGSYRRFLRTQKFVTNCPLGISLREQPAYSFHGDPGAVLALARGLILSLAFNHSPRDLTIGLVCENPNRTEWDWLKWLPHTQDRHRNDLAGTARYVWRSLAELAAHRDTPPASDGRPEPHMVVFVDTPDTVAALPEGFTSTETDTTLVVLRAVSESLTELAGRFHVSAKHEFSTSRQTKFAHADAVSVTQARLVALEMSRYRPPNWDGGGVTEATDTAERTFFDVLGITDIDTWDPRPTWQRNANDSHFLIPLGFEGDGKKPNGKLVTLDLGEASIGGDGPHGPIQGMTGTGKSMLLNEMVLALCSTFGPDKLNLILMDFKGGSTFDEFEKLPHVTANITNLGSETELLDRVGEVIQGEIIRREEWNRRYKVKDMVTYREKRRANPDKYPPYPELIIIVDEFREFMTAHKEHLPLLTSVGAVGRALGMHIIPASQFIDSGLLRELMEHLTFGVSLKTKDAGRSRTVVKTDAAKDLEMGKGQAIIYKDALGEIDHFIGFNVEAPYIAPRRTKMGSAKPGHQVTRLHEFTLSNQFADTSGPASTPVDAGYQATEYPMMKTVLLDRIAQFNDTKALPLWQPSLRAPITYHDITVNPAPNWRRLEFRIGDSDAPRLHTRLPYTITPEGPQAHIRVLGHAQSGRSTAVQAIVCSAAQAYQHNYCSFYLIDYGAKLAEIEHMPNVGGYARKTDKDKIHRYVGEFLRILRIREREFGARGVASLDDYFTSRAQDPGVDDPYGHMFLVIDGFPSYIEENLEAKDGLVRTFLRFVTDGTRYGLHLIVTADSNARLPQKMHEYFGTTIHLAVEAAETSFYLSGRAKELVKAIPDNQPGRCVDLTRGLAARILVPQREPIKPTGREGGNPTFDRFANYGPGITAFVESMVARSPASQHAPVIESAPPLIDYNVLWEVYSRHVARTNDPAPEPGRRTAMDKHLPIGVSCEDLRVVTVPDDTSPHLLAVGDTKSGKTSLLRTLINSVVSQFSPEEAQIVIIESKYELFAEQEKLAENGYLLAYADNKNTAKAAAEKIKEFISPRIPTMDDKLSASVVRNRSWYQGPELFVMIDGILTFSGTGIGAPAYLEPVVELIDTRSDLGLHVYATGPAQGFPSARLANKMYKVLAETKTATLMFSGPVADGTIWPGSGIKFAPRRPGQAALVDPETMIPEVIQTARARRWDEK